MTPEVVRVLVMVGLLIGVLVGAGVVLMILRARLLRGEPDGRETVQGVLESLRELRDRGELSEAEFNAARAKLVARVARAPKGDTSGLAGGPGASDHPRRAR